MKIAILGTKGIPNSYGGFEEFAEKLSVGLVRRGHDVTVYNPHFHSFNESYFQGVAIKKIFSPEKQIGASANFIYDFLSMSDALKQSFDILLFCGYHSNAPSYYLLPKNSQSILITNMDGLEWKRSKWNNATKQLIKKMEKIAIKKSHLLVADNPEIQRYYLEKFNRKSFCIAYGADSVEHFSETALAHYDVQPFCYYLLIARLEPENNIEQILKGYIHAQSNYPILIIGNHETKYGAYLKNEYAHPNVHFLGAIYEKTDLNTLRHFATAYFHGHSVGGTNPSLLEAMACKALIIAHDNPFNHAVLGNNAFYFQDENTLSNCIAKIIKLEDNARQQIVNENYRKIVSEYAWDKIIDQYETLFFNALKSKR